MGSLATPGVGGQARLSFWPRAEHETRGGPARRRVRPIDPGGSWYNENVRTRLGLGLALPGLLCACRSQPGACVSRGLAEGR